MKIKAFGMDIQVTESAVFVNGKEVFNKIDQEIGDNDRPMTKLNLSNMHNYSSVSSLIKPKDESEIDTPIIEVVDGNLKVANQKCMSSDELIELSEAIQKEQRMNVIGQNGNDGLHYGFWEQINNDLFNKDRLTDSNDPNDTTGIDY